MSSSTGDRQELTETDQYTDWEWLMCVIKSITALVFLWNITENSAPLQVSVVYPWPYHLLCTSSMKNAPVAYWAPFGLSLISFFIHHWVVLFHHFLSHVVLQIFLGLPCPFTLILRKKEKKESPMHPRKPQFKKMRVVQMNTCGKDGYKNIFITYSLLIIRFLEASL